MNTVIISAGMPRSGSTLMFNMLREILMANGRDDLTAGFENDVKISDRGVFLVKTHNISKHIEMANQVFYSYRDIRVAAVSCLRMFRDEITMDLLRGWIAEYQYARQHDAMLFAYGALT